MKVAKLNFPMASVVESTVTLAQNQSFSTPTKQQRSPLCLPAANRVEAKESISVALSAAPTINPSLRVDLAKASFGESMAT